MAICIFVSLNAGEGTTVLRMASTTCCYCCTVGEQEEQTSIEAHAFLQTSLTLFQLHCPNLPDPSILSSLLITHPK